MKKYFVVAALALVSVSASAQSNKADEKVQFGVRLGMNTSTVAADPYLYGYAGDKKPRVGFNVGVVADVPLVKNYFYITPGLYFTQKGTKFKYDYSWSEGEGEGLVNYEETSETKYNPLYLEIPILFSGRYTVGKTQLQVSFGPYFAVGLAGKAKHEWSSSNTSVDGSYSENYTTDDRDLFKEMSDYKTYTSGDVDHDPDKEDKDALYKRFDAGLSFGIGAIFAKHYFVGLQYELGLVDIYSSDSRYVAKEKLRGNDKYGYVPTKNRNFMITIGYNF